jgi:hypothetical protein
MDKEMMGMRKILAAAAATGIMTLGLAAAPAQASTTAVMYSCDVVSIVHTDFDVVDTADRGGARDGRASRADLWAAEAGKNGASPLLQEAAAILGGVHMLALFQEIDAMDQRFPRDGFISRADLKKWMDAYCR